MSAHVRWPGDRFLWCLVDARGWSRAGLLPGGLWPDVQEQLPVAVEDVQAVCVPAPNGQLLVCMARRTDLDSLEPSVLTLTPDELPDFASGCCDPTRLDLLVGPFEPRQARAARRRAHLTAAATVVLCAGLVTLAFTRRASYWTKVSIVNSAQAAAIVAETVGESGGLDLELETARLALQAHRDLPPPPDAALALGVVLAGWPANMAGHTQSIAVGPEGASVTVAIDGDPAPFLAAIRPPPGWRLDEPRINTGGDKTRIMLRIRPNEGGTT